LGATLIEASVGGGGGGVTVRVPDPEIVPLVAVILAEPVAKALATPVASTLATLEAEVLQVEVAVRSFFVPSVNVPVAVNF
jgi:hypothetical protein